MTAATNWEAIEDDLQNKIDTFFEKLSAAHIRQAREFRETALRSTLVDYPFAEPDKVREIFQRLLDDILDPANHSYYDERWKKALLGT